MQRIHTTVVLAAGLIGSIVLGGSPSFGEEPPIDEKEPVVKETPADQKPAIANLSPAAGPAGSEVTISGDSCLAGEKPGSLNFGFTRDGTEITFSGFDGYVANLDGTWSFATTVPLRMGGFDGNLPVEPGVGYQFHAVCIFDEQPELWVWYEPMPFEVTVPRTFHPPPAGSPEAGAPGTPGTPGALSPNPSTAATPAPATPIVGDPPYNG
jgi:hypothetical protein